MKGMLKLFFSLCLMILICSANGQDIPDLIDAKPVFLKRYKGITSGQPYYFDIWPSGVVYSNNLTTYQDVRFNYNGHTRRLEVQRKSKIYELESGSYLRAEAFVQEKDASGNPRKVIFQRGVHADYDDEFVRVLHRGTRILLFEEFRSRADKDRHIDVVDSTPKGEFYSFKKHYIKLNNELRSVDLNMNSIGKKLGHQAEIDAYVTENQLEPRNLDHIIQMLKWYESQGFARK